LPGSATQEHYHPRAEEIYFITQGTDESHDGETRDVKPGDARIRRAGKHKPEYRRGVASHVRCAPAYEDSDTVITESELTFRARTT
jgi:mannose-6-phosphate isomerase-like protein (cupin superfamily)